MSRAFDYAGDRLPKAKRLTKKEIEYLENWTNEFNRKKK